MTVESELKRIADALEARLALSKNPGVERVAAAAEAATAAEPPKKPRGRPAKITAEEKTGATEGDFLAEPQKKEPAKEETTVEDVRKALKDYMLKVDPATGKPYGDAAARKFLTEYGGGAVRLQENSKLGDEGKVGILEPKYYGAVIKALEAPATTAADEF